MSESKRRGREVGLVGLFALSVSVVLLTVSPFVGAAGVLIAGWALGVASMYLDPPTAIWRPREEPTSD